MKINTLKIGQKVYMINRKLEIEEKTIIAIINKDKEIEYQLDSNTCGGVKKEDFYLTKHKADVVKQDFLDKLKFKVGDLIIFKYKEYGRTITLIGRIHKINYSDRPYWVKTSYKNIYDLTDDDIVLKVRNEYIENFGRLKDLFGEFDELNNGLRDIIEKINYEYDLLEKDLKTSFKKQFGWTNLRKKPLFEDRFDYVEEDY